MDGWIEESQVGGALIPCSRCSEGSGGAHPAQCTQGAHSHRSPSRSEGRRGGLQSHHPAGLFLAPQAQPPEAPSLLHHPGPETLPSQRSQDQGGDSPKAWPAVSANTWHPQPLPRPARAAPSPLLPQPLRACWEGAGGLQHPGRLHCCWGHLVWCPSQVPRCELPLCLSPWAFQTQVFGVQLLLGDFVPLAEAPSCLWLGTRLLASSQGLPGSRLMWQLCSNRGGIGTRGPRG